MEWICLRVGHDMVLLDSAVEGAVERPQFRQGDKVLMDATNGAVHLCRAKEFRLLVGCSALEVLQVQHLTMIAAPVPQQNPLPSHRRCRDESFSTFWSMS